MLPYKSISPGGAAASAPDHLGYGIGFGFQENIVSIACPKTLGKRYFQRVRAGQLSLCAQVLFLSLCTGMLQVQ